jgi:hypothetical protein
MSINYEKKTFYSICPVFISVLQPAMGTGTTTLQIKIGVQDGYASVYGI